MEKFKCASNEIEASKCPTLFLIFIWYKCLLGHLEIIDDDDDSFCDLKTSCCKNLKEKSEISVNTLK